jgi:hypothetical protein
MAECWEILCLNTPLLQHSNTPVSFLSHLAFENFQAFVAVHQVE